MRVVTARARTGGLFLSRPPKPFEQTKGRISLTPKRENIEYAKTKHKNVTAWFDERIEEEQSKDPVYRRAIKALRLSVIKTQTDEALNEFQEQEHCTIDQAIKDLETVKTEAANQKLLETQKAEDEKKDLLIEAMGNRQGSVAINWLSTRAPDFGFKESAKEVYDKILEYRKQKDKESEEGD
jgi:phage-related minor tail protein